ncbi:hypothetical protein ACQKL5_05345 [Peribacillus sp. NPDC097675]|uniref:hypothetical protein n=1 Tax=Peribacillus sp. NPDC097675 TaxID=3390618 RepID=UPI003CFF8255
MKRLMIILTVLLAATGCGKKIPEPKNVTAATIQNITDLKAATTIQSARTVEEDFQVRTFVKGNSVFVECYLNDYSFSGDDSKQLAIVSVYIDNQKKMDMHTAAFILKDIPHGLHKIKLEVLNDSGQKTGLNKEIEVHITASM